MKQIVIPIPEGTSPSLAISSIHLALALQAKKTFHGNGPELPISYHVCKSMQKSVHLEEVGGGKEDVISLYTEEQKVCKWWAFSMDIIPHQGENFCIPSPNKCGPQCPGYERVEEKK